MAVIHHSTSDDMPEIEHPVSDPITGTRPVGPIQIAVPGERKRSGWNVAAIWLLLGMLVFFVGSIIYLAS